MRHAALAALGLTLLLPFPGDGARGQEMANGSARGADNEPLVAALRTAMAAPSRPDADKARDEDRVPIETLSYLGIRPDMRVLELIPGGGWYTRLLAPTLRDKGKLYIGIGTKNVREKVLGKAPFDKVDVLAPDVQMQPTQHGGVFDLASFSFGEKNLDAVLTFRNLHNLTPAARANLNRAVFDSLKPGGTYGVVDHTRRHMEPDNPENWRRLDPVIAIKEALDAGFMFEGFSDVHYRPDDELRYEVGRRAVSGNTDNFCLRFRKPS